MLDPRAIGLVMQGGGALGAYEYGAVEALLDRGYRPTVISGVSIGAVNAAVLAGARGGEDGPGPDDMRRSLVALWRRITLPDNPFLPPDRQQWLSAFGDPAFWRPRLDWFAAPTWTSFSDTSPMYGTLREIVDFPRINRPVPPVRVAVTATCIETGANTVFANVDPDDRGLAVSHVAAGAAPDVGREPVAIKARTHLGVEHVMASGALPPGFPMVKIGDEHFWDGGLFDNTPLRPLVEMLTEDEADSMPIVVIDLFPEDGGVPRNLGEVQTRMMEIQYESRFTDHYGGPDGTRRYAAMLQDLHALSQANRDLFGRLRDQPQFRRLLLYRALRNLKVIRSEPQFQPTGAMDFSAYGVQNRHDAGYRAVDSYFAANQGDFAPPT